VKKSIFFEITQPCPLRGDFIEYRFPFRLVDTKLIGSPEEMSQSSRHEITVVVSYSLLSSWDFNDDQLHRVMFEYAKRHIIQKVRDGTLRKSEELDLYTYNVELPCPFDPDRIENPINAVVKIESDDKNIMQDDSLLHIASAIIDTRDNINAIFSSIHKDKLIFLTEERDLLQFFRDAESKEDFSYRLCALANAATRLNIECLRRLTDDNNSQLKSIKLLEKYLLKYNILNSKIIDTLQKINRLRQCYPVHGDRVEGVLEAYNYFSIDYPITDYSSAWKNLLNGYLKALQHLLDALKKKST
jgi:hypothetical protein